MIVPSLEGEDKDEGKCFLKKEILFLKYKQ